MEVFYRFQATKLLQITRSILIVFDPATAPLLKEMRDTDGKPHVCENVWISNLSEFYSKQGECSGKLTAGYGGRQDPKI